MEGETARPRPARLGVPQVLGAWAHCRLSAQSSMAGSCEISNIFSNYISAMYQPDEVQPALDMLGQFGDDSNLGLSLPASQPPAQSTGRSRGVARWHWGAGTRGSVRQCHWLGTALQGPCPTGTGQQLPPCLSFPRERLWEDTLGGTRYGCWEHI